MRKKICTVTVWSPTLFPHTSQSVNAIFSSCHYMGTAASYRVNLPSKTLGESASSGPSKIPINLSSCENKNCNILSDSIHAHNVFILGASDVTLSQRDWNSYARKSRNHQIESNIYHRMFEQYGDQVVKYGFHSHQISNQLNTCGRFWSSTTIIKLRVMFIPRVEMQRNWNCADHVTETLNL